MTFVRPFARDLLTPSFLVAVGLLGAAAFLSGPVGGWMEIRGQKRPLPLKAPLSSLDASSLGPYRVAKRHIFDPMVVEALGTEMYLSWTLEDTSVSSDDPLRYANLLITYDTGGHNLVPHTPDVCRLGAGYQVAQPHENMNMDVDALPERAGMVPIRVCTFMKTGVFGQETVSVVYTFHCNGRFAAGRSAVRVLLNDLQNTYAYFSKVEVSFLRATRAACVQGAEKLLNLVLPILVKDHWPDFDRAELQARSLRLQASSDRPGSAWNSGGCFQGPAARFACCTIDVRRAQGSH